MVVQSLATPVEIMHIISTVKACSTGPSKLLLVVVFIWENSTFYNIPRACFA